MLCVRRAGAVWSGVRRHAANLLSLLRVALAPLFASTVLAAERGGSGWIAALLFAVVVASDAVDGRVARRLGTASTAGRAVDHGADIAFLLIGLATYVAIGAAPWWVPASVSAAFALYLVDWQWPPPRPPYWRADRIGHVGGVANWVLLGVLIGNRTVGLGWLSPPVLLLLETAVPIYSGAAIVGRLAARR
jgi:hypothetical protein